MHVTLQIETNRNTALTLACFQGRHEVVNMLVERQANVEHRAKVLTSVHHDCKSLIHFAQTRLNVECESDI